MALSKLPDDFYRRLAEHLRRMDEQIKNQPNIMLIKEYENTRHVCEDIIKQRKKKIILRAMQTDEMYTEGMTPEEITFYKELVSIIKRFDVLKTKEKVEEELVETVVNEDSGEATTFINVEIVKDVPPYKGADGRMYGPFKQGTNVHLPEKEARFLVRAGYGREV